MSVQLRNAPVGVIYGREIVLNRRGEEKVQADKSRPFRVRMLVQEIRSNRTEIAGQLTNNVRKLLMLPYDVNGVVLEDVGPWTVVEAPDGLSYDLTAPPIFVPGRRGRTGHWEAELKARPPSDLKGAVDRRGL